MIVAPPLLLVMCELWPGSNFLDKFQLIGSDAGHKQSSFDNSVIFIMPWTE